MMSLGEARRLDALDPLREMRAKFHIPLKSEILEPHRKDSIDTHTSEQCIYLCGNSLGLQPRVTQSLIEQELQVWQHG